MSAKASILLLVVLALTLKSGYCNVDNVKVAICPDPNQAIHLLGKVDISAAGQPLTQRVKTGRLPSFGLYDSYINCILITDLTHNQNPAAQLAFTEGGLNQRFVEVQITSQLGKQINYTVLAYSSDSDLKHKHTLSLN